MKNWPHNVKTVSTRIKELSELQDQEIIESYCGVRHIKRKFQDLKYSMEEINRNRPSKSFPFSSKLSHLQKIIIRVYKLFQNCLQILRELRVMKSAKEGQGIVMSWDFKPSSGLLKQCISYELKEHLELILLEKIDYIENIESTCNVKLPEWNSYLERSKVLEKMSSDEEKSSNELLLIQVHEVHSL
eukprot:TRINITY_DN9635_c0_g1_i1.p1 TRINITY_DN9635_c0_g1~~TRINITY_DN9635_c0_g1_i1.p1  ORF type:complete len:187 (+),score=18.03 TRINITY_DN9635_c0_g1_i1:785-1345(+)